MSVKKYVKLPVEIEAIQWTGSNAGDVLEFIGFHENLVWDSNSQTIQIPTLEGVMTANVGDFIIQGVNGEFYPCKPDIFKKTYTDGVV